MQLQLWRGCEAEVVWHDIAYPTHPTNALWDHAYSSQASSNSAISCTNSRFHWLAENACECAYWIQIYQSWIGVVTFGRPVRYISPSPQPKKRWLLYTALSELRNAANGQSKASYSAISVSSRELCSCFTKFHKLWKVVIYNREILMCSNNPIVQYCACVKYAKSMRPLSIASQTYRSVIFQCRIIDLQVKTWFKNLWVGIRKK